MLLYYYYYTLLVKYDTCNKLCEHNYTHLNTDGHTYKTHGREHASIHIQTCAYLISLAHRHTHTKHMCKHKHVHRTEIKQT